MLNRELASSSRMVVRELSTPMRVTPALDRVREALHELERMGFFGDSDTSSALLRKRLSAIDYGNPATAELIARIPGVERWLELVPTARALVPLYRPEVETLANGHVIGPELREWLVNIADALGIRNRAAMLRQLLEEHEPPAARELRWLSLASGVAQPILESAATLADRRPRLTLADLDPVALRDAELYADALGVRDLIEVRRMNVLRRRGLPLPESSFDVVEAVGILEYLKPQDWLYRYRRVVTVRRKQAGAVTLLRNAWRLVRPGGSLIVGNMLVDRPQLGFTLNVIQWPHIQPRSVDSLGEILDAAGVDGYREAVVAAEPEQRVYALYRVTRDR